MLPYGKELSFIWLMLYVLIPSFRLFSILALALCSTSLITIVIIFMYHGYRPLGAVKNSIKEGSVGPSFLVMSYYTDNSLL